MITDMVYILILPSVISDSEETSGQKSNKNADTGVACDIELENRRDSALAISFQHFYGALFYE